jgi:PAS domain S-box-containing protein/diguanylate cyclase (GGDEF)-like protein
MPVLARLLVVDNDESNRDLLCRRLLGSGYHAETAVDGEQALQMVKDRLYDLVLLDHMLPGMSGLEVLRRIREAWSDSELPVIMVTTLDDSEGIVAALRTGANDYVSKPIDFAVTHARIEARLRLARTDRELRRTRELYRLALGASEDGLWEWDLASGNLHCTPRWKSLFGLSASEPFASSEEWFARMHPDDQPRVRAEIQAHIEGRSGALESEYRMRRSDGQYRWIESRGSVSRDRAGQAVRMVGCQTDITVRKTVDPLTSLPNRAWLEQELGSIAAERKRVALVLLDLDGFDRIQESLPNGESGHFLAAVAHRFRDSLGGAPVGASAEVSRSGERQFAVVLRDASGPAAAKELAAFLQATLANPFAIHGQSIFATASAGIAVAYAAVAGDDLLRDATAALRHARERGTGQREVFQPFMRRDDLAEMHLEHDLHHALERSEFEVWYQPKVDLELDEIVGCEALLRWKRPGFGLVPPAAFIPAAERHGVIGPLGRFVLERACRDIVDLRRSYPRLGVSVNVSGRQFAEPDLVEHVHQSLESAGLDPSALHLEITETFLVEDPEKALATLNRVRALGVGLKLDDFGSGYSSLDYLQRFPFDTVKIDRTFISHITSSHETVEIVRAIIGLTRSLRLDLVAEGIENRAQLECLKELGCRYGQGYWFSPPVELDRLREVLEEWRLRKLASGPGALPDARSAGCVEARA